MLCHIQKLPFAVQSVPFFGSHLLTGDFPRKRHILLTSKPCPEADILRRRKEGGGAL
jgi:hypothetical protein